MTWILPQGDWLSFEGLSCPVRVIRGLGEGTQGQVFEVELAGDRFALKWYLPRCLQQDPSLERRLLESIRATAPNQAFLWPIALLRPTSGSQDLFRSSRGGFGYLMNLRPPNFLGVVEHVAGRVDITLRNALRACFFLAEAFHALHSKGLCYKDISLGNLFLDAGTGHILICDNDNVDVDGRDLGSVLGTPGFMAPEILMRRDRPGANSDLFSLAVLLFLLLTRHHPLKGQLELEIRCLDEPARRRLYGEDPVFIFDPADSRNRPDPREHLAALVTWPIYPGFVQSLFQQTFCDGMRNPCRRTLTGQWMEALSAALDHRQLCPVCGMENFGARETCWHCGQSLPLGAWLVAANGRIRPTPDNEIHPHHLDGFQTPQLDHPLARVVAHPGDPALLGLLNLSDVSWQVVLKGGGELRVEPGQTCNLTALTRLETPLGTVRQEFSHSRS
ncbi:MAG: protein kinase [Cyanobacteriota bacterium]|nr:protein kinase [Cyanobacteriota bacterium]